MSPLTGGITGERRRGALPLRVANFATRGKCAPQRAAKAHLHCKPQTFKYVQRAVKSALPDRHIWESPVACGHLPRRRNGPLVLILATCTFPPTVGTSDTRERNVQCLFTYQVQNCSCAPTDSVYLTSGQVACVWKASLDTSGGKVHRSSERGSTFEVQP